MIVLRRAWLAWILAGAVTVSACGSDSPESSDSSPGLKETPSSASSSPTPSATPDQLGPATVDGLYRAAGNYRLAVRCWGEGAPTIVYDAGSADTGIGQSETSTVVRDLSQRTRVCSYDRAGTGSSDPAPERKRYLDDIVEDLRAVLLAADVRPPYLMVGSSFGGFDVFHHAGRFPEDVLGLVMLDVPRGLQPPLGGIPTWDSPYNPEHLAAIEIERLMAHDRLPIPAIPVTVVTATFGQSPEPKTQRVWLEGSSDPRQVVVESGHDVFNENPDAVLREILRLLAKVAR